MNVRQLATVAFATVGVMVLVESLVGLVQLAALCIPVGEPWSRSVAFPLVVLGGALTYLAVGLWLVLRGHRLAGGLFPERTPLAVNIEVDQLLMAALMVLGIWMVTVGLVEVAGRVVAATGSMDVYNDIFRLFHSLDMITGLVLIGMGVLLILRPRRIVAAWRQRVLGEEPPGVS